MSQRIQSEKQFHNQTFSQSGRKSAKKFYSITKNSNSYYHHFAQKHSQNAKILEYGCGPDSSSISFANHNNQVHGIDISEVAVEKSNMKAKRLGVERVCFFRVMDAENLEYEDDFFDLIRGSGILHHLDLEKSLKEISRTLKTSGKAIFLEPLAYQPLIKIYRKLTPKMRTRDEHPLTMEDLAFLSDFFDDIDLRFYHFFTLAAVPFRKFPLFKPLLAFLESLDRLVFKIPFLRKYAWQVIIILKQPIKLLK